MPYRLGGGDGHIDCIQMVYVALGHMHIPTPISTQPGTTSLESTTCATYSVGGLV